MGKELMNPIGLLSVSFPSLSLLHTPLKYTLWSLALKHHTSKITTFSDLETVSTLGFRGEALSSLCGTATLSMTTSTALTAPMGTLLTFARSGECSVGGRTARAKGTTATIRELFGGLPVRRKELEKHKIREFGKALGMIQSYAMIKTGCRITVSNIVGRWVPRCSCSSGSVGVDALRYSGKSTIHIQTTAAADVRANFSNIFGAKSLIPMMDLYLILDVAADKSVLKYADAGSVACAFPVSTPSNYSFTDEREIFIVRRESW